MVLRSFLAALALLFVTVMPAWADVAPPKPGLTRIVLTLPGMR